MSRTLVVLSGPAGVGKTSIRNRLLEDDAFGFSVSATTRPPRPGESDGVDYFFLSPEEFEARVGRGDFLEHAVVHGMYRYGTLRAEVERILAEGRTPLLDVDVQGAQSIRALGTPAAYVFIKPPSWEELERRLRGRKTEDPRSTQRRLATARVELQMTETFDLVVVNDDLDRCVLEIRRFVDQRARA